MTAGRLHEVVVVGAGFSGLGMAMRLRKRGVTDFVVLEKADEVGGTWRENSYPGCGCDVPSHLYSFSFVPSPAWTHWYAAQPEILEYLRGCADRSGVRDHIRFGHEVTHARFDETEGCWHVSVRGHESRRARFLVLGIGALHRPTIPSIAGRDTFAGPAFHSARWDHDVDFTGKRVAVIGTGASAIQFVPWLVDRAARVDVFQRTPPWVLPKADGPVREETRALLHRRPALQRAVRWATYGLMEAQALGFTVEPRLMRLAEHAGRRHIEKHIADPALRQKLTPSDLPGCKRILLSNDWYPALARPNVQVVTDGIRAIEPGGVRTIDGTLHEADVLVWGTGFQVTDPIPRGTVSGLGGVDIVDSWREGVSAYKGTTVSGFPNFFVLMGPNTGLGHNSMVFMIEAQIGYALRAMDTARATGAAWLDVLPEAQEAWQRMLAPRLRASVWGTGCQSWYLDARGNNPTIWPGFTVEYWARMLGFDAASYRFENRPAEAAR